MIEDLFIEMTENFPNLLKKKDIQAQKVQRGQKGEPKEAPNQDTR